MKESNNRKISILIRFIILVFIVIVILVLIELLLKLNNQMIINQNKDEEYLLQFYKNHNNKINKMNTERTSIGFWNYNLTDYTLNFENSVLDQKNAEKKRILVVGDSFVWGWAQDNYNNLWWKQLDYMLKKNGYQNVEIIAAGMNSFSLVDQANKIVLNKEYIERVDPDLIIMGYVYNDFEIWDTSDEDFLPILSKKFNEQKYIEKKIDKGLLKMMNKVFPNLHQKLVQLLMNKEYARKDFKKKYGYAYHERDRLYLSNQYYVDRIEEKAVKPLSKMNIPVMVVNFAIDESRYTKKATEFQKKVFRLLDQYHIQNYDLKTAYNKKFQDVDYKHELQVNIEDYHPNARLMNFYCREIYKILKEDYNSILGNQTENLINHDFEVEYTLPKESLERIGDDTYKISYTLNSDMLKYPYTEKRYIKLNLKYPTDIHKLYIHTKDLKGLSVTVDLYNEKLGYEDEKWVELKTDSISENEYIAYNTTEKKITAVNIFAETISSNSFVVLERE